MILDMSRIRVLGPKEHLRSVLERTQDLGLVHFVEAVETDGLRALSLTPQHERHLRNVHRIADDVDTALRLLGQTPELPHGRGEPMALPRAALLAGRTRRRLAQLEERRRAMEEERALILKFRPFFSTFEKILASGMDPDGLHIFYLVLRGKAEQEITKVRAALRGVLGENFDLFVEYTGSGEAAMILAVAASEATRAEALLTEAGVQPLPLPNQFGAGGATETIRAMQSRLRELPRAMEQIDRERRDIAAVHGRDLARIQADLRDHLAAVGTMQKAVLTPRAFVLEGWIPSAARSDLRRRLEKSFGGVVEVETVASEQWKGQPAPVVLRNPRLFRPFEAITKMMPLPRYGTIDPTPFVAVFFPMFFGIALGDVGYGTLLALVSLIVRARSKPRSTLRSVSEIGLGCALFTIIFGFLYGELFGDLGHRLGLHPIIFSREEAVVPFLGLALALGVVHIVIGLCLGAVRLFREDRRRAIGRAMAAVIVVLIVLALLAAFEALPRSFFTPLVIALLVAFPILIVAEGILAPIEFVSTIGNVLSYARIMAVGTASVMMAVVANRMAGAVGGVAVGVLFALLFHLINFVIGVFSPTIHMLRLHYVEFFGKFFSPGGVEYEPLRHWSPRENAV